MSLTREELLALYDPAQHKFAAYAWHDYRMMPKRLEELGPLVEQCRGLGERWTTWLDISCGRGETSKIAAKHDIAWMGTEAVPSLLRSHIIWKCVLPDVPCADRAFHIISCIDVLEHILFEDWEPSVKEMARVCSHRLILCVSNVEDNFGERVGHPLHVTRLPYAETFSLLQDWAPEFEWDWVSGEEGEDGAWFVGDRRAH